MKKFIYYIVITLLSTFLSIHSYSQIAHGVLPGELYICSSWYHVYDTTYNAVFRSTDNGESLSIQHKSFTSLGMPLSDWDTGSLYRGNDNKLLVSHDSEV
jgi:hypothetical protein